MDATISRMDSSSSTTRTRCLDIFLREISGTTFCHVSCANTTRITLEVTPAAHPVYKFAIRQTNRSSVFVMSYQGSDEDGQGYWLIFFTHLRANGEHRRANSRRCFAVPNFRLL